MRPCEEDWERAREMESLYLQEHQLEMEAEWQQWMEEHPEENRKLPARIKVSRRKVKQESRYVSFNAKSKIR